MRHHCLIASFSSKSTVFGNPFICAKFTKNIWKIAESNHFLPVWNMIRNRWIDDSEVIPSRNCFHGSGWKRTGIRFVSKRLNYFCLFRFTSVRQIQSVRLHQRSIMKFKVSQMLVFICRYCTIKLLNHGISTSQYTLQQFPLKGLT